MKLSIIIPMYNAEKFMVKLLDSIYKQEKYNVSFEVIVIDDCSLDNSVQLVNAYTTSNLITNLKLIEKQTNGGTASSRNMGISHATGQFIQFVDSDDYLQSDYFKLVHNKLDDEFDCYIYGISFEYVNEEVIHTPINCSDQRMIGYKNSVCNKIYKADIVHNFNPKFSFEDVIWLVEVMNNNNLKCGQIENLYYHVNRKNQDSKMANFKQEEWYKMANSVIVGSKMNNNISRKFVLETFVGTLFAKDFNLLARSKVALKALRVNGRFFVSVLCNGIRNNDKIKIKKVSET